MIGIRKGLGIKKSNMNQERGIEETSENGRLDE